MNKVAQQQINYWRKTAEHDYETMEGLFEIKRYSGALFYSHIVLEKILKAFVVMETKERPSYTHNLVELAQEANLDLEDAEMDLLAEVNRFNIRTRYPDYKLKFYKQCTREYTQEYLHKIKSLYKKLVTKLNNSL